MQLVGTVVEFDAAVGLGRLSTSDGATYPFHCIEIADGSRVVALGTQVTFDVICKLGRYEAARITHP